MVNIYDIYQFKCHLPISIGKEINIVITPYPINKCALFIRYSMINYSVIPAHLAVKHPKNLPDPPTTTA
jgi:hypothetical protein